MESISICECAEIIIELQILILTASELQIRSNGMIGLSDSRVQPNLQFGCGEYKHLRCAVIIIELQILILTASELQIRSNGRTGDAL